jgi:hypothetical protein
MQAGPFVWTHVPPPGHVLGAVAEHPTVVSVKTGSEVGLGVAPVHVTWALVGLPLK